MLFEIIKDESNPKPNKIWADEAVNVAADQ